MSAIDDTPVWERYAALLGAGMLSSKHGIQQVLNALGAKSKAIGTTDADMKDMDYARNAVDKLSDATPYGMLASIAGNIADPVGILTGGALGKVAPGVMGIRKAALTGALSGGLGEAESGGSRATNMAFGAAAPFAAPVAGKVKNIWGGSGAILPKEVRERFNKVDRAALDDFFRAGKDPNRPAAFKNPDIIREGQDLGLAHGFSDPADPLSNPFRHWISRENTGLNEGLLNDYVASRLKNPGKSIQIEGTLGDMWHDPALYAAYPDIKNTNARFLFGHGESGGAYRGGENLITAKGNNPLTDDFAATLTHELQHKVQSIEGWPAGDNPARLQQMVGLQKGFPAYLSNPGEIEARDAAARFILDPKNQGGSPIYSMHAKGVNESAFSTVRPTDLAPRTSLGILHDDPATARLQAILADPKEAHKYPVFTRRIQKPIWDEEFNKYRFDIFGNPIPNTLY